jgi:hypothetical protein
MNTSIRIRMFNATVSLRACGLFKNAATSSGYTVLRTCKEVVMTQFGVLSHNVYLVWLRITKDFRWDGPTTLGFSTTLLLFNTVEQMCICSSESYFPTLSGWHLCYRGQSNLTSNVQYSRRVCRLCTVLTTPFSFGKQPGILATYLTAHIASCQKPHTHFVLRHIWS